MSCGSPNKEYLGPLNCTDVYKIYIRPCLISALSDEYMDINLRQQQMTLLYIVVRHVVYLLIQIKVHWSYLKSSFPVERNGKAINPFHTSPKKQEKYLLKKKTALYTIVLYKTCFISMDIVLLQICTP